MPAATRTDPACRILDTMDVAAAVFTRSDGVFCYANARFCYDLRLRRQDILDKTFYEVYWPGFCLMLESMLAMTLDGKTHTQIHYWAERNHWGQVALCNFAWAQDADALLLTVTNITETEKDEYEQKRTAYYDTALGLPNTRKLEVDLAELAQYKDVALVHFSLEHFYSVSNLYGLPAGDYLLEQVCGWLRETAPAQSQCYRTHDASFAILMRNAGRKEATSYTESILTRFGQPWLLPPGKHDCQLYCTIKIGLALDGLLRKNIHKILCRTILAPHESGSYCLYDSNTEKNIDHRVLLRQTLINCIQNNMQGFEVYYQPILKPDQSRWAGAEALCRWTTPEGDAVPPSVFISEAEQLGLIARIDDWVMQTALVDCKSWDLTEKDFFIDINVSPIRKVDERFVLELLKLIRRCEFPEEMVNLEITETSRFNFSGENLLHWERLANEGVVLSLDDFGTGYSSFNNLVHIPAKLLKTEKCFIDSLETDKYLQFLIQHTIELAHAAGLSIVTEGVETEGQKRLLQSFGADFMQGYLFSPPLSAAAFQRQLYHYHPL